NLLPARSAFGRQPTKKPAGGGTGLENPGCGRAKRSSPPSLWRGGGGSREEGCRSTRAQVRREEPYCLYGDDRRTEHVARCALIARIRGWGGASSGAKAAVEPPHIF